MSSQASTPIQDIIRCGSLHGFAQHRLGSSVLSPIVHVDRPDPAHYLTRTLPAVRPQVIHRRPRRAWSMTFSHEGAFVGEYGVWAMGESLPLLLLGA